MVLEKNTLHIGLEKPLKVLHITDSHLLPCDEIDNDYKKWLVGRFGVTHEDTVAALKEQLAYAEENCDLVLYTGDLIDYVTPGIAAFARGVLKNEKILFAAGNHDYVEIIGEDWIWMDRDRAMSDEVLGMDAFFNAHTVGGVNFVAIDDSNHQAEDWQTDLLRKEVEKGLPIVLLVHAPLFEQSLYERGMEHTDGSASYLLGCDEKHLKAYQSEVRAREQRPTEATKRFWDYVNSQPLIKAVVAGHVHFNFESVLPGGAVQYVTDLGFNGFVREITIT